MRKGFLLVVLLLCAAGAFAGDMRTFGGGYSTRWKTRGPHGHDQVHPCLNHAPLYTMAECDHFDFQRGNLDNSIGYRTGIERDFLSLGPLRAVGSADASLSYTEYNISQRDMMMFGGTVSAGVDVTRWGGRLGIRYGGGSYLTTTQENGLEWFHEVVASVPLRSGASLRISRRLVDKTHGFSRYQSNFYPMEGPIEVTETSVMFVASPEAKDTKWEFSTSSGSTAPGGPFGEHRYLKQAGWFRLTAARELPWYGIETRASWTSSAHESWIRTDFRGFPGNERSKTVDAFGLAAWRAHKLSRMFSLHYGLGIEAADWRDEHYLLLDNQRREMIGGIETSGVLGMALRMRLGRNTAIETNVEKAYWTGIRLGEIRWGIGIVLTR